MRKLKYYPDLHLKGKKRPNQHVVGEKAVKILKDIFPEEWAVREYYPDYGIDLNVELFDTLEGEAYITKGEHLLFQVKGTESLKKGTIKLYPQRNVKDSRTRNNSECIKMEVIKYPIDTELLATVEKMGNAVPVLLCIVDIENIDAYFVCLNDYIEKILIPEKPDYYKQETVTINIPVENNINTAEGKQIIEWYGKRAKLYSFFNKVNCQSRELEFIVHYGYIERVNHFFRLLRRLDVWSAADYFVALKNVEEEIDFYLEYGNTKIGYRNLNEKIASGEDIESPIYEGTYCVGLVSYKEINLIQSLHLLWDNLRDVSNIFEEDIREFFLPSYYFRLISG